MQAPAVLTGDPTGFESDLGPLAWVLDELRKSLDGACQALRRFVRDAELSRGSDLAALDGSQLRIARQQLHQAVGALEMVGQEVPAGMLRSMELLVQKFIQKPEFCSTEAAQKVERASFALTDYLEGILKGKHFSSVGLFPQMRDVLNLLGEDRVHPADLWGHAWAWIDVALPSTVQPLSYDSSVRTRFDGLVLNVVKAGHVPSAQALCDICLGFAKAQPELHPRVLWAVAAGYFEAMALGLCPSDVYTKRAASRVLLQYRNLTKGVTDISEQLVRDLLFFCAQAVPGPQHSAPALRAVLAAYGLAQTARVDYEQAQFGRYDPAVLAQARKRIVAATETWSALSGGDTSRIKMATDQFSLVSESIVKLQPESAELARALTRSLDSVNRSAAAPPPSLAMEVATAVLYLEAVYDDLDPTSEVIVQRGNRLAQRLDHVMTGAPSEPLDAWMEELYRRVSDRHTMGSVVDELRTALGEVESSLDAYFRHPDETLPLHEVPGRLSQMRGVFSVLGLDQAALAALRMRDRVERFLVEPDERNAGGVFEKLGNSLGALGFLIDMLNYQRELAKKLFVYDDELGEFRSLMGRQKAPEPSPPAAHAAVLPDVLPVAASPIPMPPAAAPSETPPAAAVAALEAIPAPVPVPIAVPAPAPVLAPVATLPPAAPVLVGADQDAEDDDAELRQIFLEEAGEVVQNGLAAVSALHETPADADLQTRLRRAFHTLKGSSRMVGLTEFGEAAWAMEQLLNAWLPQQLPATPALLRLSDQAMEGFAQWVEDIAAGQDARWRATPFRQAADRLRLDGVGSDLQLASDRLPSVSPETEVVNPPAEVAAALPAVPPDVGSELEAGAGLVVAPEAAPEVAPESSPDVASDQLPEEPVLDFSSTQILDFGDTQALETAGNKDAADAAVGTSANATGVADLLDLSFDNLVSVPPRRADVEPIELPPELPALEPASVSAPEDVVAQAPAPDEDLLPELDWAAESLPEAQGAAQELPQPEPEPEAEPVPEPFPELVFDLPDLDVHVAAEPAPASVVDEELTLPASETELDLPVIDDLSLAFDDVLAPLPVTPPLEPDPLETSALQATESAVGAPVEADPLADLVLDFGDLPAEPEPELEPQAEPQPEALPEPVLSDEPVRVPDEATESFDESEDPVKVIDSLRISLALYNVYLNEADEWSRLLLTELTEWSLELDRPLPDTSVALAHSLAGSSATVGFMALSELARALEHALEHVQLAGVRLPAHASLFVEVAEDIRRLLHQFAAGFLKTPDPAQLAALRALLGVDFSAEAPATPVLDSLDAKPEPEPEPEPESAIDVEAVSADLASAGAQDTIESDDEIDATDVLDVDLFPIFEDEAQDLLPKLDHALRQWSANPAHLAARREALRVLHTLKGSARLAGAMRLGEMAHRMESAAEKIDPDAASTAQIEPLLARLDKISACFASLRATPATALQLPEAVPAAALALLADVDAPQPSTQPGDRLAPAEVVAAPAPSPVPLMRRGTAQTTRVKSQLLDRMVNSAGEVMITRSRLESRLAQLRGSLGELTGNLERLRTQLRDIELQSESQMQSRLAQTKDAAQAFDPLEFDRFTRVQELTRMMAESVHDVATVQRSLQQTVEGVEDDLFAQARLTRELQSDLLRTRMVDFESLADRLYGVVRQAAKDFDKSVKLDIDSGGLDMDRSVLERIAPAFEHLLRNAVGHGIEPAAQRQAAGKSLTGSIHIKVEQLGNDVVVNLSDDGAGLNLPAIRAKALASGQISAGQTLSDDEVAQLIFTSGLSTAEQVSEMAGRGVGMDVVRTEVNALGGRIELTTEAGHGTRFTLVLPLTTAVTQVVLLRMGEVVMGVPSNLVEMVRRVPVAELDAAYRSAKFEHRGESLPFYWAGALLHVSPDNQEARGKTAVVAVFRSAGQRVALHVNEVLGNQEAVVKNLGPQLSHLPGLAGMTVLASGAVVLIYNPVALARHYGARALAPEVVATAGEAPVSLPAQVHQLPLVLVVDDSITVRRVTQRLLKREGFRVALAIDGLHALEVLQVEKPAVVLTDIEMPRMDGFDLVRNIRGDDDLKDLPIIMITSRIAEKHREYARALKVDHYLGKPYPEDELIALVRGYCNASGVELGHELSV